MKKKRAKSSTQRNPSSLPVIRPKVAGIDLGSKEHWVCGRALEDGSPNIRVFQTTTPQLNALVDWLLEQGIEFVAMASTSVYRIPLYELLEVHGVEVLLVNARQLSRVPGRKTDMQDCQWLQVLHSCGLLRGSFRPDEAICRLRAIKRQCSNLVAERTKAVQWMQKALDQMNVQVHRAVSDLTGKTGMSIIRAIVAGERDANKLAAYRDSRCQKSEEIIAEHLTGNWREEHLFNLRMALRFYDELQEVIECYEKKLLQEIVALEPPDRKDQNVPKNPNANKEKTIKKRGEQEIRTNLWRLTGVDLTRIDGISAGTALVVITEIGLDLASFPSEKHFASWLRLSPKPPFSAGIPVKKNIRGTGATRVANVLRMAALSLQRSKTALVPRQG